MSNAAYYRPAAALTCSEVSSLVERRARLMAWLARGHPDRLRCVRKLPLACPEPSQPGVGQPVEAESVLLNLSGRLSIRGVSWIPAATDGGQCREARWRWAIGHPDALDNHTTPHTDVITHPRTDKAWRTLFFRLWADCVEQSTIWILAHRLMMYILPTTEVPFCFN